MISHEDVLCIFEQVHTNITIPTLSVQTVLILGSLLDNALERILYPYTASVVGIHCKNMYAGHFQTSAIIKGAAADELTHGHLLCVCIQVVVDCDPSLAGCKGRILSQGESLSIQHLCAIWRDSLLPSA